MTKSKGKGKIPKSTKRFSVHFDLTTILSIVLILGPCVGATIYISKYLNSLDHKTDGIKEDLKIIRKDSAESGGRIEEISEKLDKIKDDLARTDEHVYWLLSQHKIASYQNNISIMQNRILELRKKVAPSVCVTTLNASPRKIIMLDLYGQKAEVEIEFDGDASQGSWSYDMRKILFQGKKIDSDAHDIYIYDIEKKSVRQLTKEIGDNIDPVWSPNGYEIYFCSSRFRPHGPISEGKVYYHDLFVMNDNGSNQRLVLSGSGLKDPNYDICLPSLSPDEKYIGFSTEKDKSWKLWVMATNNPMSMKHISDWGNCRIKWNPTNNNEIVFVRDRRRVDLRYMTSCDLIVAEYVNRSDKIMFTKETNLTELYENYPDCNSDNFPDWSIDGSQIIFSTTISKNIFTENTIWSVYTIHKNGTRRKMFADKPVLGTFPDW